jgi:uncharacterized membrane protein YfcA
MDTNDILLFILTLISAFMGINFGGTMLLIVPLLLSFGYTPLLVLSSTRPAVIAQSLLGIRMFRQHRDMNSGQEFTLLFAAGLGGLVGVSVLSLLTSTQATVLMISLVIALVVTSLYRLKAFSSPNEEKQTASKSISSAIYFAVGFCPAIMGGLVGAGAGPIVVLLSFLILQKTTYATAYLEKFASLGHASLVLVWTLIYGSFNLKLSLIMLAATLIGGYLGAKVTLKLSPYWMYAVITILCLGLLIRYLLD